MKIQSVCVFCGSSPGRRTAYEEAAENLGQEIAGRGLNLVFGGACVGLMGAVARAALSAGGHVIGVIPHSLAEQEVALEGLLEMHVVGSMHERKAMMADFSDAFVALPGGFGTYEEFFEALTWSQLGIHTKPCGLLNVEGYYDQLLTFLDHAVEEDFIDAPHRKLLISEESSFELMERLFSWEQVHHSKMEWVRRMSSNSSSSS